MGRVGRRAVVDLAAEVDDSHGERFRCLLSGHIVPAGSRWCGLSKTYKESTSGPTPEVRVDRHSDGVGPGGGGSAKAVFEARSACLLRPSRVKPPAITPQQSGLAIGCLRPVRPSWSRGLRRARPGPFATGKTSLDINSRSNDVRGCILSGAPTSCRHLERRSPV